MSEKTVDQIAGDWVQEANHNTPRVRRSADGYQPNHDVLVCIGERSTSIKLKRDSKDFDVTPLQGEGFDDLVSAIREKIDPTGFPVVVKLSVKSDRWHPVEIENVGIAGITMRDRKDNPSKFENLIESSKLIASMCRPTNRPVRAWSSISDICGSDFVSLMGIHARTEAEFILKKLHSMNGVECLRDYASGGKLPDENWITRLRLIASDLEDLDDDPMGRIPTGLDALTDIQDNIASQIKTDDPDVF